LELTERQILILRGLVEQAAVDVPAAIVDQDMDELIDLGYVAASKSMTGTYMRPRMMVAWR
jgi:hypothetical protein